MLGRIDGLTTQIHQLLTREGVAPLLAGTSIGSLCSYNN